MIRKWLNASRQFGFDPVKFINACRGIPRFTRDLSLWRRMTGATNPFSVHPVLADFRESAGSADGHYFWQDLIAARWVHQTNPQHHLDVGSRVDGFVAHLLTFRAVTLLDVRPVRTPVPGLSFTQGNAQEELGHLEGSFDSVSSLHAIEHFGLGRYGDPLQIDGHLKGLRNIANCVAPGGTLYVSFPIGKPEVHFNAQRVLDPVWPLEVLTDFSLEEFVVIPWRGEPTYGLSPSQVDLSRVGQAGLYRFVRPPRPTEV